MNTLAIPTNRTVARDDQSGAASIAATRLHFCGLCLYVLAQAYLIPLRAIGPSWTLWPTLADVAVVMLCLACCYRLPAMHLIPRAGRGLLVALAVLGGYCLVSFILFSVLLPRLNPHQPSSATGLVWGAYQIVRFAQFLIVFFVISTIPLSQRRQQLLRRCVMIALLFACASIFATYASASVRHMIVAHLPTSSSAGPWALYERTEDGLGTLSYNHGDCAAQILLLFSLAIHFRRGSYDLISAALLFISLAAIFLTGSRTVLLASLVYAAIYTLLSLRVAKVQWLMLLLSGALVGALVLSLSDSRLARKAQSEHGRLIQRQFGDVASGRTNNLSGRVQIWRSRIRFLNEKPIRWVFGCGFGSGTVSGPLGHNLTLTIVLEIGLIGLFLAGTLLFQIMRVLWRSESADRTIFWLTVVLLITCVSRDTFYPIPHTAHFIGFFLVAVGLAIRSPEPNERESDKH